MSKLVTITDSKGNSETISVEEFYKRRNVPFCKMCKTHHSPMKGKCWAYQFHFDHDDKKIMSSYYVRFDGVDAEGIELIR